MLDRHILKTNYGVSYGSVTLKSLQNDNIPELDLLVRESIQNSSDAALNLPGQSYCVTLQPVRSFRKISTGSWPALKPSWTADMPLRSQIFWRFEIPVPADLLGVSKKANLSRKITAISSNWFMIRESVRRRQTQEATGALERVSIIEWASELLFSTHVLRPNPDLSRA